MKIGSALLLLMLVGILGCSSSEPVDEPIANETEQTADETIDVAAVEAKLALADLADGTADHVVGRCAACALGMEGKPEYALEAHGYELHFCSEGCRDGFAENTDEAILAMVIPDEPSEPAEY